MRCRLCSKLLPLLPGPFSINHTNILMELQHLQDIYQDRVNLNKLHASTRTLALLQSGFKHAHCSSMGPQHHPTPAMLLFSSLPPFLPVSQCGSWSEGYFNEASVEHQSISCIWWIFPDWDKLGSRTKRFALPSPSSLPSPTQPGRDLHSSLVAETLRYTSFPFSLFIFCLSISSSPNNDTSQRERCWFKPQVNAPGLCFTLHLFRFNPPPTPCDLFYSNTRLL